MFYPGCARIEEKNRDVQRELGLWRSVSLSAADLDMVKLRPLVEAARKRDDESGSGNSGLYQVREQSPVYRVA